MNLRKGQKVNYKGYNDEVKTGIIEWTEPLNKSMPYNKVKLTNGNVTTRCMIV